MDILVDILVRDSWWRAVYIVLSKVGLGAITYLDCRKARPRLIRSQ